MSFAAEIKAKLCLVQPHSLCCRKALIHGFLYSCGFANEGLISVYISGKEVTRYFTDIISSAYHISPEIETRRGGGGAVTISFQSHSATKYIENLEETSSPLEGKNCSECAKYFLRGVFLACGLVSDPQKEFRLDLSPQCRTLGLFHYLNSLGLVPHTGKRNGKNIIYIRSGEKIGDFFGHLGLMDTYFDIQNEYLRRELNNLTNRQNNVMVRNIGRSVESTAEQVRLIRQLKEQHLFSLMPEELIATAELRLQYEDYSLAQLAAMAVPAITKSGLNHRLKKIVEFARQHLK